MNRGDPLPSLSNPTHPKQDVVIQAMLRPETYPGTPDGIVHIQTHISHIFIAGGFAYKIKKPVDFGFLDFSTLPKRRYFCHQEVLLNRRLTTNIYLGVVKIASQKGKILINGRGRALEYAVQMSEMSQERMMDRLLAAGKVTKKDIRALVRKLVPFYQRARTGRGIDPFGRIEVIGKNVEENFIQTQPYVGRLVSQRMVQRIQAGSRAFLKRNTEFFQERVREGRIRDGHGDLHSGNICLDRKIQIYDCIEFNHRFRYADIACDLAFLSMDLDFHGYPDLSELLIRDYARLSGDRELPRLLDFYQGYRSYVRAKVHSFSSEDPELPIREKRDHIKKAKRYYRLADYYTRRLRAPQLIVVFGLMGTGKTTLAGGLARKTGWPLYSSDEIRKTLVGIDPATRKWEPFNQGIYSERMSRRTYKKMRSEAQNWLKQGQSVILDGSYKRHSERLALLELAEKSGAEIRFLECRIPIEEIRRRLEQRGQEDHWVSDGRWAIFNQQRRDFDPVVEPVKSKTKIIRTIRSSETLASKIISTPPKSLVADR
jgi:uncharacterized protein